MPIPRAHFTTLNLFALNCANALLPPYLPVITYSIATPTNGLNKCLSTSPSTSPPTSPHTSISGAHLSARRLPQRFSLNTFNPYNRLQRKALLMLYTSFTQLFLANPDTLADLRTVYGADVYTDDSDLCDPALNPQTIATLSLTRDSTCGEIMLCVTPIDPTQSPTIFAIIQN